MTAQVRQVTGERDCVLDRVERPHGKRDSVKITQAQIWQQKSLLHALTKIRRSQQRNRQREIGRQGNGRGSDNQVDLGLKVAHAAGRRIQHHAVKKKNTGFETAADHLGLGENGALPLIVRAKRFLIEGLHAAEQSEATRFVRLLETFRTSKEISGHQSRPGTDTSAPIKIAEQRDAVFIEPSIVSEKIVIDRHDVAVAGRFQLAFQELEIIMAITAIFAG